MVLDLFHNVGDRRTSRVLPLSSASVVGLNSVASILQVLHLHVLSGPLYNTNSNDGETSKCIHASIVLYLCV